MDVIAQVFANIWEGLTTYDIPIINCSIATFLICLLIINIVFGFLNFLLGKRGDSKGD